MLDTSDVLRLFRDSFKGAKIIIIISSTVRNCSLLKSNYFKESQLFDSSQENHNSESSDCLEIKIQLQ